MWRGDEQPKTVEDIFVKDSTSTIPQKRKKQPDVVKEAREQFINETSKKEEK